MASDENPKTISMTARTFVRIGDHYCLDSTDPECAIHREELGITPLHQAAFDGSLKKVKKLLDEGVDVNIPDKKGWRPLHDAAMEGYVEIVKYLLSNGADPNVQDDEYRYTPLHDAVRMNHLEVVRLLLKSGANLSIKDSWDETPLDIAREHKFQAIVDLLSQ